MISNILYFFVLILAGYDYQDFNEKYSESEKLIISILPLGEISNGEVVLVSDSISLFCNCRVRILDRIVRDEQIMHVENWINPFQKNIFEFLDSFSISEQEKIIAITDIPFKLYANDSSEATIRGISNMTSTIISNAQIIRDATKYDVSYEYLLVKVVKHELGNMLGLMELTGKFGHCPDTLCIMTSSFPTPDNFINSKYFCNNCIGILNTKIDAR
jgi:predicted Zn-dependent protease